MPKKTAMIHVLGEENSIFNTFLAQIRDKSVQTDRFRFRRNMERVGEIFAYEVSKKLVYKTKDIETPLGELVMNEIASQVVLSSILRAGLPLHQGLLNYFDDAENAFISAYRKYSKDGSFKIHIEYLSSPDLTEKTLVLSDPMLATGASMLLAYKALLEKGEPQHTHIVSIIASKEGVDFLQQNLDEKKYTLWLGAIDDELTAKSYIVPGLGDAGDLAYGSKI